MRSTCRKTPVSGRATRARTRRRESQKRHRARAGGRRPARRHLRGRRAARARRLARRASTSTTSTSTSACRRAASSPPRSPTASRRRRCTGCSSPTASTRRCSPRSSCARRCGEFVAALGGAAGPRCARASLQYLRDPFHARRCWSRSRRSRGRMPTGLFDNRADRRLPRARCSRARPRTNDFRKLARKLFLVATQSGHAARSVMFGARRARPRADLARDRGVERAARPVSAGAIDGEHYVDGALNKTLHASVALDEGVDLLLCINPLVPFDASVGARGMRRARPPSTSSTRAGFPAGARRRHFARSSTRACRSAWSSYARRYPRRGSGAVRAGPRGRRDVLRQHLQLLRSASASARSRSPRRAQTCAHAPRSLRAAVSRATASARLDDARSADDPQRSRRTRALRRPAAAARTVRASASGSRASATRARVSRTRSTTLERELALCAARRGVNRRGARHGDASHRAARASASSRPASRCSIATGEPHITTARHRRRDEHQPGQPVLPLPQQGRHHRRAVRRLEAALTPSARRTPAVPGRRGSVVPAAPAVRAHAGVSLLLSRPGRDHVAQPQASRCAWPTLTAAGSKPPC